ncbi:equilibrative nucleoside transporter 1-like [Scylla paramamosain]|uniref:equilibrative nucleoside transporter 1-like n=1 Tax=Scylla paramamosain TaxID=85552 RepID=UPI003083EBCD
MEGSDLPSSQYMAQHKCKPILPTPTRVEDKHSCPSVIHLWSSAGHPASHSPTERARPMTNLWVALGSYHGERLAGCSVLVSTGQSCPTRSINQCFRLPDIFFLHQAPSSITREARVRKPNISQDGSTCLAFISSVSVFPTSSSCTKHRQASPERHEYVRGRLVYFCFLLLGLGTLLPWNFFITAQSYWDFKLENKTANGTRTHLQDLYTPMQVCLSQIPNFIFLFINALFSHKIPQRIRLLASLTLMILLFCITTVFTQVDTSEWQIGFFALTMTVIILINSAGAIFQGGLFGVAGMFPEKYITAVVSGQALGGVFASGARIVSLSVGAKDENSAFIYFMIAVIVMIFTLLAYLFMSKTDFYKHYTNCQKPEKGSDDAPQAERTFSEQVQIFKEIWPLGVSVWGVFAVTLGAFPALCVKIISTAEDETWSQVYFQPVVTFLLFNVGDYIGRQVAGFMMWVSVLPSLTLFYGLQTRWSNL